MHYQLIFLANKCLIQEISTKKMIGTVDVESGLYKLKTTSNHHNSTPLAVLNPSNYANSCTKILIDIWHCRLGHLSNERMLAMKQYYPNLNSVKEIICDACHKAKQKKLIFPISSSHYLSPFTLIHVDIWGPCSTISIHGHKYFLTIVDDHTRFVWVLPMSSKAETQSLLQGFIKSVERQFDTKVKTIA